MFQQLRALERELGTKVTERRGRGVVLTEPGRALAGHAQRIVDALGAAEAEVQSIAGLRAGVLRFGWFSTAGALLVPRAIARFQRRHPQIELVLEEADPDMCAQRLCEGELDLAVVYEFRLDEPLPAELILTPLLQDRLHIALPPDHRLAHRKRIRMAELANDTWIQGAPSRYRPPAAEAMAHALGEVAAELIAAESPPGISSSAGSAICTAGRRSRAAR